jgi:hypothetical protein
MLTRSSRRWLATIGLVAVAGVGTTIGLVNGAGATSGTGGSVSRAVDGPVTTAGFTFSASLSGVTTSPVSVTGSGKADLTTHALSLTVNVPAVVAKRILGGSDSPEVVNAVLSGGTVYLEIPSLASRIGAPWISVALPSKASSAVPVLFTKIATALGDVNAIVRFADAHHATVSSLGNAVVDGVHASGSRIVATRSTRTLTASVWADASDRLVQATVAVTATGTRGTHGLTATVDFSGYGSQVTIVVPQPAQVKAIPFSVVRMFLGRARV